MVPNPLPASHHSYFFYLSLSCSSLCVACAIVHPADGIAYWSRIRPLLQIFFYYLWSKQKVVRHTVLQHLHVIYID